MRLAIPLDPHFRPSVHFFRYGIHVKVRLRLRYWHFVVKVDRGRPLSGKGSRRRQMWIGWWSSCRGVRGEFNGMRIFLGVDRYRRLTVKEGMRLPVYPRPHKARGQ